VTALPVRSLGDRRVSAIGLGCMSMSWAYVDRAGDTDDDSSIAVIRRAVELGVTHVDTADVYGPHHNEDLVGRALQGDADTFVATKVGLVPGPNGGYPLGYAASPERIRTEVEGSLRRLRRDVIDLYYLHRVDPQVPLEETWGAMADLVTQGKVRMLGMSEASIDELERAHRLHPVTALQSELSLWTRDAIATTLPWCADHGVAFVAFSPLGRGFLTGTVTEADFDPQDFRAKNPRFAAEALERNREIVRRIEAVAQRYEATSAQVAIAWTLAKGEHVLSIPGTRRTRYLEENVGAARIDLLPEDVGELDALPEPVGSRY
jgi:aryl-alcohol dehydrogenase-like predicted oxidoreductase